MSKILANQIANYGDSAPIELKEGLNIPAGKAFQVAGSSGTSGQVLTSTGTALSWTTPFSGNYNDLTNQPTIPPAQVRADWNATGTVSEILNKPIVPPQPSVSVVVPSNNGNLTYNNTNGEFTFTPPDLSGYASNTNEALWNQAYNWGDHAQQGYATTVNAANWDTAYGWGDHAQAGYLTAEADTLQTVMSRGATTSQKIIANAGIRADVCGVGGGTGNGDVQLQHNDTTNVSSLYHYNTLGRLEINSVNSIRIIPGTTEGGSVNIYHDADGESETVRLQTTDTGIDITGNLSVSGTVSGINIQDLDNVDTTGGLQDQQVLKWSAANSAWEPANDLVGGSTGIVFADLSVVTNSVGTAALSYNNTNGVFTYTPPDLSGYLTTETDPVFSAHVASGILQTNINNWNTAYGWGNHASAGYATTTQLNTAVANSSDWDTAYGWGDHAQEGYLTSYTEQQTLDDVLILGPTTTRDITTTGKIFYANAFPLLTDLQAVNASTYHGMFAHAHDTGHGYFAHAGAWTQLLDTGSSLSELADVATTAPNTNDVLTWDGSNWAPSASAGGGGGANVTISDTAPGSASAGDLWWESDKGRLKIYYNDTDSTQWVDASPPLAQPNVPVAAGNINMNANSPTWTGTTGYSVAKSGGDGSAGGGDVFYTLTFPAAYSARTDYIVQASYDGTDWVSANGAQIGIERNTANVVFCVRRWNEDPLNLGDIMITITNL